MQASAVTVTPTAVTVTPTVVTVTPTAVTVTPAAVTVTPAVVILTPTVVILGLVPRICSGRRIPGGRWWILATRARMTERGGDEGEKRAPVFRPEACARPHPPRPASKILKHP